MQTFWKLYYKSTHSTNIYIFLVFQALMQCHRSFFISLESYILSEKSYLTFGVNVIFCEFLPIKFLTNTSNAANIKKIEKFFYVYIYTFNFIYLLGCFSANFRI